MKTPDEIKKGLEHCNPAMECDGCPYQIGNRFECINHLLRDSLAYIQQLEAQVPKWISVEERLPEAKLCVLGYGVRSRAYNEPDPFAGVHDVYTRGEDEGWLTYWNRESVDVTHWMPLPEPPKEGIE